MKRRTGTWIFVCILLHLYPWIIRFSERSWKGSGIDLILFSVIFYGIILDFSQILLLFHLFLAVRKDSFRKVFDIRNSVLFCILLLLNALWLWKDDVFESWAIAFSKKAYISIREYTGSREFPNDRFFCPFQRLTEEPRWDTLQVGVSGQEDIRRILGNFPTFDVSFSSPRFGKDYLYDHVTVYKFQRHDPKKGGRSLHIGVFLLQNELQRVRLQEEVWKNFGEPELVRGEDPWPEKERDLVAYKEQRPYIPYCKY